MLNMIISMPPNTIEIEYLLCMLITSRVSRLKFFLWSLAWTNFTKDNSSIHSVIHNREHALFIQADLKLVGNRL